MPRQSPIIENKNEQHIRSGETGKGWDDCQAYCHPDATFSAQTGALAEVKTLEGYPDWMKCLFTPIPDGRYELKFFAADEERGCVAAFTVFHGTQTGPGKPLRLITSTRWNSRATASAT